MSTRSVVAILQGDGWKGRYIHSDGYPTWVGTQLAQIVQRDGLSTAIKRLTADRYGWSSISADQPDISKVHVDPNATYSTYSFNTPEYDAWSLRHGSYSDGRFVNEAGYGIAYTTHAGQSSEDQWISSDNDDDWGTEWAYVLTAKGLVILKNTYSSDDTQAWRLVGGLTYDSPVSAFQVAERAGYGLES